MNKASYFVCCISMIGLSIGTAFAYPVTVKVTGHVTQWVDYTGLLGPSIAPSQPVTAQYTYDTVEPPAPWGGTGQFAPPATQTNIVVNLGPFTLQTGSASQFAINVMPPGGAGGPMGQLSIDASNNLPLSNGIPVNLIELVFMDTSGQWPTSAAPPPGAPVVANLADCQLRVEGPSNQNYFQFLVQIDSVTLVPAAIDVSPAAGSFLPQQHFDAAVWLPSTGAPVATMQASSGGNELALTYPGTCQLAPPNSAARPALICPGADAALTSLEGLTQIDWLVTLTDGSVYSETVQWSLAR